MVPPASPSRLEQLATAPSDPTGSSAAAALSSETLLEQAQARVMEVASSDFTNLRERIAGVLHTLAELAARMDAGAEEQRNVQEIRFQAKRLERQDVAFAQSIWVEKALLAALAVLDGSGVASRTAELGNWIRAARDAAHAIPDQTSLVFEQATIQDALRTTVSAFTLARRGYGACASQRTASERSGSDGR